MNKFTDNHIVFSCFTVLFSEFLPILSRQISVCLGDWSPIFKEK